MRHSGAPMELKLDSGIIATFKEMKINDSEHCLWGISVDGRYCAKIELGEWLTKENNLEGEVAIMRHLNAQGCMTAPEVLGFSTVTKTELQEHLDTVNIVLAEQVTDILRYMIVPAYIIPPYVYTPDILMAVVEQKKLGVWHGDIHPEHIMIDPRTNCIKLIDYDQAIFLDEETRNMPTLEYFKFLDEDTSKRFGQYNKRAWWTDIGAVQWETHFEPFMRDGAVNLGSTFLFKSQETTLDANKIYHTFSTPDIYADGERTLDDRIENLDKVTFEPGERVLDIGCNAGLLTHYLLGRGCAPWGIDIDPAIIDGARIIANIMGKDGLEFECLDIDNGGPMGHFDTIMLFSVIHHTRFIQANTARIAKFCKRLIIECRALENGAKPDGESWSNTTNWKHDNVESLIAGLETMFPGFKHSQTFGQGDRDRYMFELLKSG